MPIVLTVENKRQSPLHLCSVLWFPKYINMYGVNSGSPCSCYMLRCSISREASMKQMWALIHLFYPISFLSFSNFLFSLFISPVNILLLAYSLKGSVLVPAISRTYREFLWYESNNYTQNESINIKMQFIRIHQTMKGTSLLIRPGKLSLRNCLLSWEQVWPEINMIRVNLTFTHPVMKDLEDRINWENWRQASYVGTPKKKKLQNENEKNDKKTKTCVGDIFNTGIMGRPWYVFSKGRHLHLEKKHLLSQRLFLISQDGPLLPLQFLLKSFFFSRVCFYL